MEGRSLYTPSEWGKKFHSLTHDEALGAGSAGPGKSLVLLWEPLAQIFVEHERCTNKKHPYYQPMGSSTGWALHLRRTSPMLEHSIQRAHKAFPILDPKARWDANKTTWVFSSGYRYQFGHCNEANDWERYLSAEFSIILFDELVQFNEEQYDQIITRLRSSDPVLAKMLKIRSMSNPVMRRQVKDNFTIHDPYWVRKRFVEPCREGGMTLKKKLEMSDGTTEWNTCIYLPAKLKDNPDPEFRRQYEKRLVNAPPHLRRALLDGDWYVTADSYYGEVWNEHQHICEPFRIPEDWPCFRAMDWGYKKQGCVLWGAIDGEGVTYVFKEYTFQNKTADIVAREMREVEKDLGLWGKNNKSKVTGPADTQLWEERGDRGKSKAQEFMDAGIQWTKADKKSRQRNAERLSALLSTEHGTKDPGIVFFKGCRNTINTIPAIQTSPTHPDEPADGGEDHWHDAACYLSSYVSRGRSFVGMRRDDDDEHESESEQRNLGRYGYGSPVM